MAVVVIGGHTRNIGKTSVVAALIARLSHLHWTAFKITQFGHGFCTADGAPCDCQTDEHTVAVSLERPGSAHYDSTTDSARFLEAGAERSFWVRTRIGNLAAALPRIRKEIATSENVIIESNSIMGYIKPDLYLSVLDAGTADFKDSARLFLDRANAILLRGDHTHLAPRWSGISAKLLEGRPHFGICAPDYMSKEVAAFVEEHITSEAGTVRSSSIHRAV
jgi:hypothetical protein